MLLEKARQGFAFYCQVANRSPKTIEWYDTSLRALEKFLQSSQNNGALSVEDVTRQDVQRFIAYLQGRHLSPFTVHTYYRAAASFFHWATREKLIESSPLQEIPKPQVPKLVKPRFSENEIKALLEVCKDNKPLPVRNRAIILVLLDSGLRASELCGLTLTDLEKDYRRALVLGKGSKQRFVIFGAKTRQALWQYLNVHRPQPKVANTVFLTAYGKPLDANKLAHILKKLGTRAGIEDCHAHKFRHTFARLFLRNGGSVLHLQALLGHESLAVTSIYARLETEDLEKTHERASPVDRLGA